jgi:hypothetical protein
VNIKQRLQAAGLVAGGTLASVVFSSVVAVYGTALMLLPVALFYLLFGIPLPWFTKIVAGAAAVALFFLSVFKAYRAVFKRTSGKKEEEAEV